MLEKERKNVRGRWWEDRRKERLEKERRKGRGMVEFDT